MRGPAGNPGANGVVGPRGERGPKGDNGATGKPGADGRDGVDGRDGDRGPRGPKGEKGDKGDPGERGAPGAPGRDGGRSFFGGAGPGPAVGISDEGVLLTGANRLDFVGDGVDVTVDPVEQVATITIPGGVGGGEPGAHPNLAAHDTLGLATQAELNAHAAAGDPHPGYLTPAEADAAYAPTHAHPYDAAGTAASAVSTHEGAGNPHPTYETSAEAQAKVDAHAGAADPHTGYLLESAHDAAAHTGFAELATQAELDAHAAGPHGGGGAIDWGEVGDLSAIDFGDGAGAGTLDEAARADHQHAAPANPVTAHEGASDPHPGYLTAAEGDAAYAPTHSHPYEASGAVATHAGLADPHPGYLTPAEGDAAYEASGAVATHAGLADPHTGYLKETDVQGAAGASAFGDTAAAGSAATASRTDHRHSREANPVTAHEAAGDPHPTYLTAAEGNAAYAATGHGHTTDFGEVGDIVAEAFGDVAAAGASGEVADAAHRHAMPANPVVAHEAAGDPHPTYETSAEAAAKITAHEAASDPHTGYLRESDANYVDLTDGGATTLHSHAGGGGGLTMVPIVQNIGRGRAGKFDITGLSGLTADKPVLMMQTAAPVPSRGNARDEMEFDSIELAGYVVDATTIRVHWKSDDLVIGDYAFAYAVSG